jgi:Family of unknown function (DUF6526)
MDRTPIVDDSPTKRRMVVASLRDVCAGPGRGRIAGMANDTATQSLKNHAKFVPAFHFFAVPILLVNFVFATYRAINLPRWDTVLAALVAAAMVVTIFLARTFALKVQDRVIRLEMRLRLRELLPPDLVPRIAELTPGQLVALRFAGDRELPVLARRVLDERLEDKKAIKQLIADWQADHLRA